jgi:segregation and condensation protein B
MGLTMSDETDNPAPLPPAPRKRGRKARTSDLAEANLIDNAEREAAAASQKSTLPETTIFYPPAAENAIGTAFEPGHPGESSGGDPNSPADSALTAALKREENLASSIVNVAMHSGDESLPKSSGEYPNERDPMEDPVALPETDIATESSPEPEPSPDAPTDPKELERVVEALLFAAMEPITVREIARAADSDSATIRKVIKALKETGDRERRPWDLVEVANAYRFVTRAEFHSAILRLKTQTSQRKLTQAALETLALIAYRQPIGRAEIESVRGVNAGPVLRLLLEKKLVQISGRGTGLGQPLLYGTTDYFLENFGLKNVTELPKPGEFKNA